MISGLIVLANAPRIRSPGTEFFWSGSAGLDLSKDSLRSVFPVVIGSGHWNSQFSRGLLSAFTRLPKYRPNYATPIYELGHVGYSGFDSHTTTLAPPSKRGFFSRFMLSTPTGIRTRPEPVESV
jgi:hypothetical protein